MQRKIDVLNDLAESFTLYGPLSRRLLVSLHPMRLCCLYHQ